MSEKNFSNENDKVTQILLKVRMPVLSCLAAIVLAAVVYSVISTVNLKKKRELANRLDLLVEKIEKNYDGLKLVKEDGENSENETVASVPQQEGDSAENASENENSDAEKDFTVEECCGQLQAIADEAQKGDLAARALIAKGDVLFSREQWQDAKDSYLAAFSAAPNSYLAGIALFDAASSCDKLGDSDGAVENYSKAAEHSEFSLVPRALFNKGRVLDSAGKYADAAKVFEEMGDKFADNDWTYIAKSRLLSMKAAGLVD